MYDKYESAKAVCTIGGAEVMKDAQLIVAGNAFDGLEGVHRVPPTKVWVEAETGPDAE